MSDLPPAPEPPAAARARRNVLLLWWGQFISVWGDACFQGAIPLVIKHMDIEDKGQALGLVLAFGTLPFLLLSVPLGALVDRVPRKGLLIGSDLARAGTALAIAGWLVVSPDTLGLGWLCALAFLLASFSTVFLPARDALIPEIVGEGDLFRANALVQTSGQLGPVIGWVVAGVIVASLGRAHLFTLDAISYLVSAALLGLLVITRPLASPLAHPPYLRDLAAGLADVWRARPVRALLLMTFSNNLFIMGPALVASAHLINTEWALTDTHYVAFECAFAVGMLAGTGAALWLKRRVRVVVILLGALLWDGVTYAAFSTLESYPPAVVLIALHAIGVPLITVSRTALVQRLVPARYLGRTFALVGLTVTGATALSLSLTGILVDRWGAMPLFLAAGVGGTLTGLWGLSMRELRAIDAPGALEGERPAG